MALDKGEIVDICRQELSKAQGWDSDELATNRERALDYFYNRPRGDEQAGRSTIQSTDVSDMVEAVMSNITPILSNETLIQFEAAGEQDEEGAQLESDFTSYMVGGQNRGYVEITSAVKDALLLRNGFIKISVESDESSTTETLNGLSEAELENIINSNDTEKTITLSNIQQNDDVIDTFNATVRTDIHRRNLIVEAIPPENIIYSPDHDSPYLDDIRFIGERKLLTQTELIEMGYSKKTIEDLPSYDVDTKNDSVARRQDEQTSLDAADPSQRIIETWEIHIRIDEKQNGVAELRHIHLASTEILMDEPAEWVPYATGSPFIVPHRLYGQSLFDKLRQIQDSKTHFLRQWHDNAKAVNNSRLGVVENQVNMTDVLTPRPGGVIRIKNPSALVPVPTNDQGASILSALQYLDKQRGERGGASLDLTSAQMQLAGQVGDQGAERQISIKEQLAAMMTATLANTLIRSTYLLVHKTLREYMPGELTAKLNGKWVGTNPEQWPERKKVNVMTGLSQGEKIARITALTQIIQTQVSFMQQGQEGEVVNKGGVYNAIMDWSRAANLDNPEKYWLDPDSQEAQQAAQAKQQQAAQEQQAMQQAQQQQAQMQQQIFTMQAQLDKYKHDTELQFKYASESLSAAIDEAKIVGAATLELQREQQKFDNDSANQEAASNVA